MPPDASQPAVLHGAALASTQQLLAQTSHPQDSMQQQQQQHQPQQEEALRSTAYILQLEPDANQDVAAGSDHPDSSCEGCNVSTATASEARTAAAAVTATQEVCIMSLPTQRRA